MPKPLINLMRVGFFVCVSLMCLSLGDAWASEHPQSQGKAEAKQENRTAKKTAKLSKRSEKRARRDEKKVQRERRQEVYQVQLQEREVREQQLRAKLRSDGFENFLLFGFGVLLGIGIGKFLPRKRKA